MAKRTPNAIDKQTIATIDAALGNLDLLSEALQDYSDRLIQTNWGPGDADLNLFPSLAAERCDKIVSDIGKALSRVQGIAQLREEVRHDGDAE